MNRLTRVNGQIVDLLGGSTDTLYGPFQSYADWNHFPFQFSAYTGMWGFYVPQNVRLKADCLMQVWPKEFPNKTRIDWDVTPDPNWGGVNGYLAVAWGNYDNAPSQITPKQVKNIATLNVDASWTYSGDASTGMLSEMWLSSQSAQSGAFPKLFEVGYQPKVGTSHWFLDNTTRLGSFTDGNGLTWNVQSAMDGTGTIPYFLAWRQNYLDFKGSFRWKDYFNFLVAQGVITGNEWVNGLAYGIEPVSGKASLTIDTLAVTYA